MNLEQQILTSIIEFASCTFLLFALLLWMQRGDNRSRRFFALAYAVCGIDLFLRIVAARNFLPTSFEALHPGYLYMALLEVPLFLLYIIEVINPGWLNVKKIGLLFSPWLVWNLCFVMPGLHFRELDSLHDIFLYAGECNVWIRLCFVCLILPYSFLIFYIPYNWGRSKADLNLIRLYGCGFVIMALFFIASSLSGSAVVSSLHLLYGICFCFYLAYNELFLRLRVPADKQGDRDDTLCSSGQSVAGAESLFQRDLQPAEPVETNACHRWNVLMVKMEEEKLWQNPDLTLAVLAKALATNRTTLSSEIHAHGYVHLTDFIASYRIRAICRMIDSGEVESLNDAFFEVGYRSRSVAFTNFKKQTGMTPGQYLKMKRAEKV